ncbi:MAG: glutathione S-transferase family protein [Gammaproteobacteria bacterium]
MITLYQFAPVWDIPNISPACVKVETFLRMTDLAYQVRFTLPPKAPKGKLPYIEDQGKTLADSRFIIQYLKETYGVDPDKALTTEAHAVSNAMQRFIEDTLYWEVFYTVVRLPQNRAKHRWALFHVLPPVIRDVAAFTVYKRIERDLIGQGIGRHSWDEVIELGKLDLSSLSDFLAEKPYFMGEQPTVLDATAFGFLVNLIWRPIETPLKEHGLRQKNLVDFCERMKQRYFAGQGT